jgi:hypothetical protein
MVLLLTRSWLFLAVRTHSVMVQSLLWAEQKLLFLYFEELELGLKNQAFYFSAAK